MSLNVVHAAAQSCLELAAMRGLKLTASIVCGLSVLCALDLRAVGQKNSALVQPEILVLPEQVVEEQWPVMLDTVTAPKELKQVEPGQCIRFGVAARGERRGELLKNATFSFDFALGGNGQRFSASPPAAVKLTTPSVNEFIIDTL